jgi:hypothetical protein
MNKIKSNKFSIFVEIVPLCFILFVFATLIFFLANVHMDEFIQFFSIKYNDDQFKLINFSQGYNAYLKKEPLFHILIHQPFQYVGPVQSFLFKPYYFFCSILYAKYFFSLTSLIIIYLLYFTSFGIKKSYYILAITFVPLIAAVMHDSGPVNISIIIFLASRIIIKKIFETKNRLLIFLLFVILFSIYIVGLYDKIFFIYLFPSIFLFSLTAINFRQSRKKLLIYLTCSIAFFIYSYFFVKSGIYSVDFNQPVISLKKTIIGAPNVTLSSGVNFLFNDRIETLKAIIKNFDYPFFLTLNYDLTNYYKYSILGITPIIIFIFIIFNISKIKFFLKNNLFNDNTILFSGSLFSMIFMFLFFGGIRLPHHTIFIYLPIIGLILNINITSGQIMNFIKIHIFSLLAFFLIMLVANPEPRVIENYNKLHEAIIRNSPINKNIIINFSGWNYYYIESLNKDNLGKYVTYVNLSNKYEYSRLLKLVKDKKGVLINVFSVDKKSRDELHKEIEHFALNFEKSNIIYNSKSNPIYLFEMK